MVDKDLKDRFCCGLVMGLWTWKHLNFNTDCCCCFFNSFKLFPVSQSVEQVWGNDPALQQGAELRRGHGGESSGGLYEGHYRSLAQPDAWQRSVQTQQPSKGHHFCAWLQYVLMRWPAFVCVCVCAEWGSTKTGEQKDLIVTALNCVLKVPQYLPQERRFDIRVLVSITYTHTKLNTSFRMYHPENTEKCVCIQTRVGYKNQPNTSL